MKNFHLGTCNLPSLSVQPSLIIQQWSFFGEQGLRSCHIGRSHLLSHQQDQQQRAVRVQDITLCQQPDKGGYGELLVCHKNATSFPQLLVTKCPPDVAKTTSGSSTSSRICLMANGACHGPLPNQIHDRTAPPGKF